MAKREYDMLVIGSGAAGSAAATTAAGKQVRVAMVESDRLGGTCLNYGCDPTKTMLYTAQLLYLAQHAKTYGLKNLTEVELDWPALLERVQKVIKQMRGGTPQEAQASLSLKGVELLKGEASFISPHEVNIAGQAVWAERIVIATGCVPGIPPIEGLKETGFITNVQAVALPVLPRRLAIAGGGPIGLEFAQLFHRFGVEVTVVERTPHLLDTEDRELAEMLCKLLAEEGIQFKIGTELSRVQATPEGKRLTLQSDEGKKEELVVDELLVAVGRKPNLEMLHLEAAGVETTKKGIKVDATLRTNVPHIWAAGDVTGGYQFTHVAVDQGKLVAHNAFADQSHPFDDRVIPWGTYTYPALAHVGQTEEQLRKEGIEYRVARMPFSEVERAIMEGQTEGQVKLLIGKDRKILGGHILAVEAGNLLAPVVLAMRFGLTVDALADTMLPYPTMAEGVRWAADKL
jgi:dihydrolipoamide dehydrogenase